MPLLLRPWAGVFCYTRGLCLICIQSFTLTQPGIGEPSLDQHLDLYPALMNLKNSRGNARLQADKENFVRTLCHSAPDVTHQLFEWTAASTGLSPNTLSLSECARLFAEIFATVVDDTLALRSLRNFQMHRLENTSARPKLPRAQTSLASEIDHCIWDSDLTDLESDEDISANFGSESGDDSSDEETDETTQLSDLLTPPSNEPFNLFCRMVPDKHHAKLWQRTFWGNKSWWPALCAFWNSELRKAFSPPSQLPPYQMRKVKPKKDEREWLPVVRESDVGKTIYEIADAATLIDAKNPHCDQLFFKIRAQYSLCETLDSWVAEARTWERTRVQFIPIPPPGACPLDCKYPGKPGWALWRIMQEKCNDNLIPRQKIPDAVEFLVSQDNFERAWNSWFGLSLQVKGYDLRSVDLHELYSSFIEILSREYDKENLNKVVNPVWRKILTRTAEVRITEKMAEEWAFEGRPRAPTGKRKRSGQNHNATPLPSTACVQCAHLPIAQHCRRTIVVDIQDVEFLRGCGITRAPEGERMKPMPPPKSRANKPVPKIYTPSDLHARGLKFDGIERDEAIIKRCHKQVIFFENQTGKLAHHEATTKCKPIKRGGQFDFYGAGDTVGSGSSAASGGRKGSGYAPIAGFEATTLDGIDIIFNEVEDATVMLAVMRAFHPDAHRLLLSTTQAADRMGKSGMNTYRCTGYCSTQHSDDDPCHGICTTTKLRALPWEYAFCLPVYGYYLHTYENMLWTFLGSMIHGTMLPSTRPLPLLPLLPVTVEGNTAPICQEGRRSHQQRHAHYRDVEERGQGQFICGLAREEWPAQAILER
ncbi:hypothetical protein B0H11DRAFT_1929494 [Mycena galericulata]|nr:hypothetical protein B0H11DRAFT_1929494 [Mycena galericulata]